MIQVIYECILGDSKIPSRIFFIKNILEAEQVLDAGSVRSGFSISGSVGPSDAPRSMLRRDL